jgi:hypothetical protein
MPNSKISTLTSATTPLAGTETLPVVQSTTTKQVSVANLTAGRAVAMGTGSSVGLGSGSVLFNVTGGSTSAVAVNFQAAGVDKWLTGMGAASANGNYEIYNTAGVVAVSIDKTSSLTTLGAGVSVTGTAATTGNVTVGAAAAGTNRYVYINGVVNKAGALAFQESGSTKWLLGNGSASENGVFELYDAVNGYNYTFNHSGNFTFPGNIIQGAAAKGVNFTANTPASGMTSQLLNWYEEGNCSLTLTAGAGSITSSSVTAKYTRTGRLITITGQLSVTNNGTGSSFLNINGLPFTPAVASAGVGREGVNTGLGVVIYISAGSTTCQMFTTTNTYPVLTGSTVNFTMNYTV